MESWWKKSGWEWPNFWKQLSSSSTSRYWLTREVYVRALGLIYLTAFAISYFQSPGLLGEDGILPIPSFLSQVRDRLNLCNAPTRSDWYFPLEGCTYSEIFDSLSKVPTLLWFDCSDVALLRISSVGMTLSVLLVFGLCHNIPTLFTLWALYQSLVSSGQLFYGYGWESQLLETGFLAIFMVPTFSNWNPFKSSFRSRLGESPEPSRIVIWLNRWLIFRIMIGAGLIKLRGGSCWWDLSCLDYHYETQPIPNPVAYFAHILSPQAVNQFGVLVNHFVELVACWFALFPLRPVRHFGGIFLVGFQFMIASTGNLSFLNYLTIVPSLCCFDDSFFYPLLPSSLKALYDRKVLHLQKTPLKDGQPEETVKAVKKSSSASLSSRRVADIVRKIILFSLLALILTLSVGPVKNLISPNQIMNTSYDPLRLVNTYGAFGSVGKVRHEVVLMGTMNQTLTPADQVVWEEYEFKCKPGDPDRRPCVYAPYHYRLDWQIWFSAFQSAKQNGWLVHMMAKLLAGAPHIRSLIARDPFQERKEIPVFIKADLFEYHFTRPSEETYGKSWWTRKYVNSYIPPVSLSSSSLNHFLNSYGWSLPNPYHQFD